MSVLVAENISYRDRLRPSSFTLERGFTTFFGPSGSGKTTAARLLIGALGLSSGQIRHLSPAGRTLLEIKTEHRSLKSRLRLETRQNRIVKSYIARYCGYVAQTPEPPTDMTVEDYIYNVRTAMGNKLDPLYVAQLLERLGIANKSRKIASEQSGGEQQRTAIAFALANKPTLLVADEPNASLDSATGNEVLELTRSLADEGTSVLWITHTPEHQAYADHLLTAKDGIVRSA